MSSSVKTRKEAKQMALADSISATKARAEKLRGVVENQMARKEEYAAIISQQSDGKIYLCKSWPSFHAFDKVIRAFMSWSLPTRQNTERC